MGSTGSIGRQTLDVVEKYVPDIQLLALTGYNEIDLITEQIKKFNPAFVCMADETSADKLKSILYGNSECTVLAGKTGLKEIASLQTDILLNSIVGFAGLEATLAALKAGTTLALANKESLVAGGRLVMELAQEKHVPIIPVDSEHSAIYQCLQGERKLRKLLLTASGGPFRDKKREEIYNATAKQALQHPNWSMGPKITIDSASMANKGLEVIEARWLFGVDYKQIDVVIHPQSIVHSMVEYLDGSTMAQLGRPDMRVPILYALSGGRYESQGPEGVDLTQLDKLTFQRPDNESFPALPLAYAAGNAGGTYPTVYNAANECAVQAFLTDVICFGQIPEIIDAVLNRYDGSLADDYDGIMEADRWGRHAAAEIIRKF